MRSKANIAFFFIQNIAFLYLSILEWKSYQDSDAPYLKRRIITVTLFFSQQVGEEEEKLAEGIKLFAISATSTSKRTMLSDLITVRLQFTVSFFLFEYMMLILDLLTLMNVYVK